MKWVTRDFVHLDRVASPWLIARFVDRDAEFCFVPWGQEDQRPDDAIPLGLPGVELSAHDQSGTTFQKIIRKYQLDDPALDRLARVIDAGVRYVTAGYRPSPDDLEGQIAVGLITLADGMLLRIHDDNEILRTSFSMYDAVYTNFRAHHLLKIEGKVLPRGQGKGPTLSVLLLRNLLKEDRSPFD